MKLLIQRVSQASVCIDDSCFGSINSGLLIFIGIGVNDTKADIKYLARKISKLRVFEDPDKKIKLQEVLKAGGSLPIEKEIVDYWNNLEKNN